MTAMSAAQAWLVMRRQQHRDNLLIRWRQQRDNSDCGSNGGGANLARLGGSSKMARRQQKQIQDGSDSSDGGGADCTWRQWQ